MDKDKTSTTVRKVLNPGDKIYNSKGGLKFVVKRSPNEKPRGGPVKGKKKNNTCTHKKKRATGI